MTKRKPLERTIAILLAFALVLTSLVGLFSAPSAAKAESGSGVQQYPALEGKYRHSDSTLRLQTQFKSFMDIVDGKPVVAEDPGNSQLIRFDSIAQFTFTPLDLYGGYYYLRVPEPMRQYVTSVKSDAYAAKRTWQWDEKEHAFKVPIMALNKGLFSQTWIGANPNYLQTWVTLSAPWSTVAAALTETEGNTGVPITFYARFKNGDLISNMMNNGYLPTKGINTQIQTNKEDKQRMDNFISRSFMEFGPDSFDFASNTLNVRAFYHINPLTTYVTSFGNKPYLLEIQMSPQIAKYVESITMTRVGIIGPDVTFTPGDYNGMKDFTSTGHAQFNIFNEKALNSKAEARNIFSKSLSGTYPYGLTYKIKFKSGTDLPKLIQDGLLDDAGTGSAKNRNVYFASYLRSYGVELGQFTNVSDRDGLVANTFNSGYYSFKDTDGDGLTDLYELKNTFTNPNNADSDGDGKKDGDEVNTHQTDPNVPTPTIKGIPENQSYYQATIQPQRLVKFYKVNGGSPVEIGSSRSNDEGHVKVSFNQALHEGDTLRVEIWTDKSTVEKYHDTMAYANPERKDIPVTEASTVIKSVRMQWQDANKLEGNYKGEFTGKAVVKVNIQDQQGGNKYKLHAYNADGVQVAFRDTFDHPGIGENNEFDLDITQAILDGTVRDGETLYITAERKASTWTSSAVHWLPETPIELAKKAVVEGLLPTPELQVDVASWNKGKYKKLIVNGDNRADKVVYFLGNLSKYKRNNIPLAGYDEHLALANIPGIGFDRTKGPLNGQKISLDMSMNPKKDDFNGSFHGSFGTLDFFPGQFVTAYIADSHTGRFSKAAFVVVPRWAQTPSPKVTFGYDTPSAEAPDTMLSTINVKPGTYSSPKPAFVDGDVIKVTIPGNEEPLELTVGEDLEVNDDGSVTIVLPRLLENNETVSVTATDKHALESKPTVITKKEVKAPTIGALTTRSTELEVTPATDAQVGDQLVIQYPDGNEQTLVKNVTGWEIDEGEEGPITLIPDSNGTVTIDIPQDVALKHGDLVFADHVDGAGNRGTGSTTVQGFSLPPQAAFGPDDPDDGTTTLIIRPHEGSNFNQGDQISITLPNGQTAVVTIGENGQVSADGSVTVHLNDNKLHVDTNQTIRKGETVKIRLTESGKKPSDEITLTRNDVAMPVVDPIWEGDKDVRITPPTDKVETGEQIIVQLPDYNGSPGLKATLTYKNGKWVDPYDEAVPIENGKLVVRIPVGYEPAKGKIVEVKRIDNSGNRAVNPVTVIERPKTPAPNATFGADKDGHTTINVTPGKGDTFKAGETITVTIPNTETPESPTTVKVTLPEKVKENGPVNVDLGKLIPANTTVSVTVTGKSDDGRALKPSDPVELTKKTLGEPGVDPIVEGDKNVVVTPPSDVPTGTKVTVTVPEKDDETPAITKDTTYVKDEDGNWVNEENPEEKITPVEGKITIPVPAGTDLVAKDKVNVTVKDPNGNKSNKEVTVQDKQATPTPAAKFGNNTEAGNTTVVVTPGENDTFGQGDTITVEIPGSDPQGEPEKVTYVVKESDPANGPINVDLKKTIPENTTVKVIVTDKNKKPSAPVSLTKKTPAAPQIDKVFAGDDNVKVKPPKGAESGDKITVKVPSEDGSTTTDVTYVKDPGGNGWTKEGGSEKVTPNDDGFLPIPLPGGTTLEEGNTVTADFEKPDGNKSATETTVGRASKTPTNVEQAYEKINEDDKTPTKIVKGRIPADGFDKTGTTVTLVDESGNPIMHNDAPITGTIGEKVDGPDGDSYYPVIIPIEDENGDKLDDSKKVTIKVQEPQRPGSVGKPISLDLTGPNVLESGAEQREFDPIADVTVTINPETPAEKVTVVVGDDEYPLEPTEDGKYQGSVPNPNNEPITIIAEDNLGNKTSTEMTAKLIKQLYVKSFQPYTSDESVYIQTEVGADYVVTIQRNGKEIAKESGTIPAGASDGVDVSLAQKLEKGDKIVISAAHGDKVASDLILVVN